MSSESKAASGDAKRVAVDRPPRGVDPEPIEHLLHASTEADGDVALEYIQRAAELLPEDARVQDRLQKIVFSKLARDPYVEYLTETPQHYVISFRSSRPVVILRARALAERSPNSPRTHGEHTVGMLVWLMLGLVPTGIGALLLSPLVASRAIEDLFRRGAGAREQRLACVTILLAALAGLLGMIFSLVFVAHLLN